jgi:hypothetical protein
MSLHVQVSPKNDCPHCGEFINIQMDETAIWGDERFNPSEGTVWVCNECGRFYIVLWEVKS